MVELEVDMTNIHLYQSPFTHETRILRITKSLSELNIFDQIIIIASLRDKDTKEHESIDANRKVWRIPGSVNPKGVLSKILITFQWSYRAYCYSVMHKPKCVNAHSLSTLPLGVLLKLRTKCKLVYDAHEIETETTKEQPIRRYVSKIIEKLLIGYVDFISLTSDGHALWYREHYSLNNVFVFKNYPYLNTNTNKNNYFRKKYNIGDTETIFLYQGAISKHRGTDFLMNVFTKLPSDKHIIFMGFGSNLDQLFLHASKYKNIHYHEAVDPNILHTYTSSADVGVHMMDDSCVNHLYALPNKPMEYMNSGLACIVSNLPEMSGLIRDANSGWIVPINDEAAFINVINSLTDHEIEIKQSNAKLWATNHIWENEEKKLITMYSKIV